MSTSYTGGYVGPQELTQEAQSTQAANAAPVSPAETPQLPLQNADQNLDDLKTQQLQQDSWGNKVYHGVLSALGGKYDTQFIPTPQGVVQTQVANTPGQQWKRIIGGAIAGVGGAAAAGTQGPGGAMRGLGGGIQAGYGQRVAEEGQKEKTANTQFEQDQKAAMTNAQTSMLAQQKLNLQWEQTKQKMQASRDEIQAANEFEKVIGSGGSGTRFVAHAPDLQAAIKIAKADPSVHADHAGGYIQYNDHIDPETGKHEGVDAYYVAPTLLDSKVPFATTISVPVTKDGKATTEDKTIDGNTLTYRDWFNVNNTLLSQKKDQALTEHAEQETSASKQKLPGEIAKTAAETDRDKAEAEKTRSEMGGGTIAPEELSDASQGLASGRYLMGKDFPLRTQKQQADARQYAQAANQYSMQHYNLPYSPELVRQEAAFAQNQKTQAFLESVDSMIGSAGNPGQLDRLLLLAEPAGLGSYVAPYQGVKQNIKQYFGDTDAKKFEEALSDAQSKLGGLIGNPLLGGGDSDLKLKTAREQFGSNATLKNLKEQAAVAKEIMQNARSRMITRNRYLQQRYGEEQGAANQGAANAIQPGETVKYDTRPGHEGEPWVQRNNQWIPAKQ